MIEAFPSRDLSGTARKTDPGPGAPFDVIDLDAEPRQTPGTGPVRNFAGGFESFRIFNTAGYPRHARLAFLPPKIQGDLPAILREFQAVPARGSVEIRDFMATMRPPSGFVPGALRVDWFGDRPGEPIDLNRLRLSASWSEFLRAFIARLPRNLAAKLRDNSSDQRIVDPREFEYLGYEMSAVLSVSAPVLGFIPRRIDVRIGYRVRSIHTDGAPPRLMAEPFGGAIVRGFDIGRLLAERRGQAVADTNEELRKAIQSERARILYPHLATPNEPAVYGKSGNDGAIIVVHP